MSNKSKYSWRRRQIELKKIVTNDYINNAITAAKNNSHNFEMNVENVSKVMNVLGLKKSKKNFKYIKREIAKQIDKPANSNTGKSKKKSLMDNCEMVTRNDIEYQTYFVDVKKLDEDETQFSASEAESLEIVNQIDDKDEVLDQQKKNQ
ncbi:UNVERIFIED_CONTAM: hypothetical protein RMT77_019214 [Armadillidium vulgare]